MTRLIAAAVLFDMDGTLVDSTAMVEAVWAEFAAANSVDARRVIDYAHGRPSRDTVAKFAADPDWKELSSKYSVPITANVTLMSAADYSPLK